MSRKRRGPWGCKDGGFTILEALIASVILAIGSLGLLGMQITAMLYTVDAKELTIGTHVAAEMIERIQFNKQNNTEYNNIDTSNGAPCPNVVANSQAAGDCNQWQIFLNNSGLTGARGQIVVVGPLGPPSNNIRTDPFPGVAMTSVVPLNPLPPPGLNQTRVFIRVSWATKGATSKASRFVGVNFETIIN